ncbi:MAG: sugar ABC transporter ATP-binding protein [Chloroflexi bacterium]|nr:sugar ABC transporter ATP-binding protein [Chloroflexota bacterium]
MIKPGEPILRVEKISKIYPGVKALSGVDFDLHPGEVRALLGKNGAGKSTLVKILSGATLPDSGTIYINGQPTVLHSPASAFAAGVSTVYQEMSLVRGLTVAENILLGRWPRRSRLGVQVIDQKATIEQARAALDLMGVAIDMQEIVGRLNIPEQQLVEIAKALSFNPKVLILDEPTSSLPQAEVDNLLALVRRLAETGMAIIYVSHRLQEIPRVADSLTILRDGNLMGTIPVKDGSPERIASMMIGSDWTKMELEHSEVGKDVRLSVQHLSRKRHLDDVSFELHAGEVLGLAGLLGSGRTELLRAIFGIDPCDSGEIFVDGVLVPHPAPALMKEKGLGLTPEDRKAEGLVLVLGADDNLTMSCPERISWRQIISTQKKHDLAQTMVDALSISTPSLETQARSLSGGNQQKLVIGKWLNANVKILLMDEPTRGIDIQAKEQVYKVVRGLAKQGISVIFVSSEIEEVLTVSDRIIILNQGSIVAEMPAKQANLEQVLALAMQEKVTQ